MKTITSITALTLFAFTVILFGCGNKDDSTTKKDDKTTTQPQTQKQPETNATAPKIGKTWDAIQKKDDELGKTIESKKLDGVHEIAFAIRDLVKSLPGQSAGLGSDKVNMLNTHVKEIEKNADLLDKYGDANDYKNAKATMDIFNTHLQAIKAMYPVDSFN